MSPFPCFQHGFQLLIAIVSRFPEFSWINHHMVRSIILLHSLLPLCLTLVAYYLIDYNNSHVNSKFWNNKVSLMRIILLFLTNNWFHFIICSTKVINTWLLDQCFMVFKDINLLVHFFKGKLPRCSCYRFSKTSLIPYKLKRPWHCLCLWWKMSPIWWLTFQTTVVSTEICRVHRPTAVTFQEAQLECSGEK